MDSVCYNVRSRRTRCVLCRQTVGLLWKHTTRHKHVGVVDWNRGLFICQFCSECWVKISWVVFDFGQVNYKEYDWCNLAGTVARQLIPLCWRRGRVASCRQCVRPNIANCDAFQQQNSISPLLEELMVPILGHMHFVGNFRSCATKSGGSSLSGVRCLLAPPH